MNRIKEIRVQLSTLENSCTIPEIYQGATPILAGAEITLAWRNIQRAKMWLGKALEAFGRPTPYPDGDKPESQKIEKQAEQSPEKIVWDAQLTVIGRIKELRKQIQENVDAIHAKMLEGETRATAWEFLHAAKFAAIESKMWLGQVLHIIGESIPETPAKIQSPQS